MIDHVSACCCCCAVATTAAVAAVPPPLGTALPLLLLLLVARGGEVEALRRGAAGERELQEVGRRREGDGDGEQRRPATS